MKLILLVCLAVLLGIVRVSAADAKELAPVQKWEGSVDAGEPPKGIPAAIVNAVDFAAIWKQCGRAEALPALDWTKHFAVCQTTSGSRLNLGARLDAGGDAKVAGIATRDFRAGFRYVIAVYPRDGVKSVNGTKLP
jgi:hypothetical protein